MPLYIIRPKDSSVTHSLNITNKKFTSDKRKPQLEEAISLWKENKTYQNIAYWIKENSKRKGFKVVKDSTNPGVTGTYIIQMNTSIGKLMEEELTDAFVIENIPVKLVNPQRNKSTAKAMLDLNDIWHLDKIGLTKTKKRSQVFTGKGITIAVLDTGIDPSHPALDGKILGSYRFKSSNWEVEEHEKCFDMNGHGTHVAGLICGKQIGVAPGSKVVSGMTLANSKGEGTLADLVLALE